MSSLQQLQIIVQDLFSHMTFILEILIQQRIVMRQLYDELDAIHSQLEDLQAQPTSTPLALEIVSTANDSSPSVDNPIHDMNLPTDDIEIEDMDPLDHPKAGTRCSF